MSNKGAVYRKYGKKYDPPSWFKREDYEICENFNLIEWAVNIKFRRQFLLLINEVQKIKDDDSKKIALSILKENTLEDFLSQRSKFLRKEMLKAEIKQNGSNLFTAEYLLTVTNENAFAGIKRLNLFELSSLKYIYLDAKNKNYADFCAPEYIMVNLSLDEKQLIKEFKEYLRSNKERKGEKNIMKKFIKKPPEDFKKICEKFHENHILEYFDLKIFAEINSSKILDGRLSLIIDSSSENYFDVDKIRTYTKRIVKRFTDSDDYFFSLMYQAQTEFLASKNN